jgi:hypothetical protein
MREVSTCACEPLLLGAELEGISHKELLDGQAVDLETLRDRRAWIDWEVFVELVERYEELSGEVDGLELAGAQLIDTPGMQANRELTRGFRSLRQLFEYGGRLRSSAYYTNFSREFSVMDDGRYRIVRQIPQSFRGSEAVFQLHAGMIRVTPRLLGRPDAELEAQITPHRGVYILTPPRESLAARIWSKLGSWGALEHSLRMLVASQQAVARQRGDARARFGTAATGARAEMDAVATPLMVTDVWGENELRVSGLNRMMEIQTGIQDRDAAGRRLEDVFQLEEAALLAGLHWRCVGTHAAVDHEGMRQDRSFRTTLVPILGENGDVVRIVTSRIPIPVLHDTSEPASA